MIITTAPGWALVSCATWGLASVAAISMGTESTTLTFRPWAICRQVSRLDLPNALFW